MLSVNGHESKHCKCRTYFTALRLFYSKLNQCQLLPPPHLVPCPRWDGDRLGAAIGGATSKSETSVNHVPGWREVDTMESINGLEGHSLEQMNSMQGAHLRICETES